MKRILYALLLATACCTGMVFQAQAHTGSSGHWCDTKHDGPNCWCAIFAAADGKCTSAKTKLEGPGDSLCKQYPLVKTGKEKDCGARCAQSVSGDGYKAKGQTYCNAGAGGRWIIACSDVGAGPYGGEPNRTFGKLTCTAADTKNAACACSSAGYAYDWTAHKCIKPNIAATVTCPPGFAQIAGTATCKHANVALSIPICPSKAGAGKLQLAAVGGGVCCPSGTTPPSGVTCTGNTVAATVTCGPGTTVSGISCVWPQLAGSCTCTAPYVLSGDKCNKPASYSWN